MLDEHDTRRLLSVLAEMDCLDSTDHAEAIFPEHSGDFFAEVTAGCEVYVLSRILHDWDDHDCLRILGACRAASDHRATLLILERLLPDHDGDSLAVPWDIQMLAITGGREHGRHEYAELLRAAGFRLEEVRRLPVDMNLLIARRRDDDQ